MSSKQTRRTYASNPNALSYGSTLGQTRLLLHKHNGVPMFLRVDSVPCWEATVNNEPVTGTFDEVIAAIDGKALPTGPQAPQHIRTVPKE